MDPLSSLLASYCDTYGSRFGTRHVDSLTFSHSIIRHFSTLRVILPMISSQNYKMAAESLLLFLKYIHRVNVESSFLMICFVMYCDIPVSVILLRVILLLMGLFVCHLKDIAAYFSENH